MTKCWQAILVLCSVTLLNACGSLPKHSIIRAELPAKILFNGGPVGAVVLVNGVEVARLAPEQTIVIVGAGSHLVQIRVGDEYIFDRNVFVQNGVTKTVSVK